MQSLKLELQSFVLCFVNGWRDATPSIIVMLMRRCLIVGGNYKTIIIMKYFFPQIVIDGRRIRWKWWSRRQRYDTMMVMKSCCCGRLWCDITWLLSMHSVSPPNHSNLLPPLALHYIATLPPPRVHHCAVDVTSLFLCACSAYLSTSN